MLLILARLVLDLLGYHVIYLQGFRRFILTISHTRHTGRQSQFVRFYFLREINAEKYRMCVCVCMCVCVLRNRRSYLDTRLNQQRHRREKAFVSFGSHTQHNLLLLFFFVLPSFSFPISLLFSPHFSLLFFYQLSVMACHLLLCFHLLLRILMYFQFSEPTCTKSYRRLLVMRRPQCYSNIN